MEIIIPIIISLAALGVSIWSLATSLHIWRRSFRPIVSAAVKTREAGNVMMTYDLVIINSGKIPARNIRLSASETSLQAALGKGATDDDKKRWLACFNEVIPLLLNGDKTTCSFGNTQANDTGFWKYKSKIDTTITYTDWFGRRFEEKQDIYIFTSDTFTGYLWG